MPHDQLDNLVKVGQLKAEPASETEVDGLISARLARLRDAGNETLSIESRFDLAYNASHALSLASSNMRPRSNWALHSVRIEAHYEMLPFVGANRSHRSSPAIAISKWG